MEDNKSSRVVPRAGALKMGRGGQVEDVNEDAFEDEEVNRMNGEIDGEEDAPQEDDVNDAGETMTAFNLREEREDGYFDENGNFVWKEEEEEQDAWVASLTETAMEQAVGEASRRKKRSREEMSDANPAQLTAEEALERLRRQLAPEETVKGALRRLGGQKTKDAALKKRFDEVVDCSGSLLSAGYLEVYDADQSVIDKWLKRFEEPATAVLSRARPKPPAFTKDTVFWEYKGVDGAVHGPFGASQLLAWQRQGYFTGEMKVEMRRVAPPREAAAAEKKSDSVADELLEDLSDDEFPGPWTPSTEALAPATAPAT